MTILTTRGGSWLIEAAGADSVFTPERLTGEHRLIAQTAEDFMHQEVLPALEALERKDWGLARRLVARCGELGLLGTDVPEVLGGVQLDTAASLVVVEAIGHSASFATTFGAQTGLSLTPLLCFGTDEQKRKYVPRLVAGEIVGAYALSESGSGSDALSARARAIRQPDGSFMLSGEKMWITNGGFADLFIVFASASESPGSAAGEGQFTAFVVERGFAGVSCGNEEHKMGLHGSSTTPLILQDVRVPAENVLGEVGKGHKVAFNVLNHGRYKLAAMCSGGARQIIGQASAYASQRKQFGRPIASFGAVRHKLADMTVRLYAVESMLYRTAGLLEQAGGGAGGANLAALEELAIEASILKVAGSEMLDRVVDENVQIHGGNGFVRDYPAERYYRDARVNRIFEGTNEINRLLIPGMLARRALKGTLPLIPAARQLQDELLMASAAATPPAGDDPLEGARGTVASLKKVALMVLGTAMQTYGSGLTDEQEVLTRTADIVIDAYAAESVTLRAAAAASPVHEAAARVYVNDAAGRVELGAREALAAMAEGDTLRTLLAALRRLLKPAPVNTVALRRQVADAIAERRGYPFR